MSAIAPISASGFDRIARHESRMAGLNLGARNLATEPLPGTRALATDFSDLQVSGAFAPARFSQDHSRSVSLADGGWLVVWDDDRNGSRKIYWQRYDAQGSRVGDNVLVAGSSSGADYVDPDLAIDTLGRVCLFFRDRTNGLIYGSRYDADLQSDLAKFLVNDTSFATYAGPFDVEVFPDGQMVVALESYSVLGSTIQMRLYSPSGSSLAGPTTVNSDAGSAQHWVPSVAVSTGGYVITWEDYRFSRADIFARQFTGSGIPVGGDFSIVPPPYDASAQYAPQVVYSSKDKYVIGWVDQREGQEIYLQRYDQTTGLVGGNQLISGGEALVTNWNLSLAVTTDGQVMSHWADFGAASHIMGLRLDSGLVAVGTPQIRNLSSLNQRWSPSASINSLGNYGLVWTEVANDDANINFMLFDNTDSRLLVEEDRVNDDIRGAHASSPQIIAASDWYDLVCYADRRNDAGDIFVKAIALPGYFANVEQKANQDVGSNLQSEPSMAVSSANGLIVWIDSRMVGGFSGQRIYGRFVSHSGLCDQDEFMISDTTAYAVKASPKAVMNGDGQGLVAWVDRRDGTAQVWGRWLATSGSLDGGEFMISLAASDSSAVDLQVCLDTTGHFYVIWLDIGLVEPAAKCVWFNSDKSTGDSFSWASDVSGVSIGELAADVNPDGNVTLFWSGALAGERHGYFTQLAPDGSIVIGTFGVIDGVGHDISDPSLSVSNRSYYSLTWVDRRDGVRRVYYQLFTSSLALIGGNNQPISTVIPEFMASPQTDAHRGRAWFIWADPRQDGISIYASNILYDPTSVEDDDTDLLPSGYSLSQNYPNPFNPTTAISFTLPVQCEITLSVYNVLGQKVATLADGIFPAGENSVVWNGSDASGNRAASGVYLYRLETPAFTESRKMMLLK